MPVLSAIPLTPPTPTSYHKPHSSSENYMECCKWIVERDGNKLPVPEPQTSHGHVIFRFVSWLMAIPSLGLLCNPWNFSLNSRDSGGS